MKSFRAQPSISALSRFVFFIGFIFVFAATLFFILLERNIQSSITHGLFGVSVILLMGLGISIFLRHMAGPISHFEEVLSKLKEGNLEIRIDPDRMPGRELASLAETFNIAVSSLKEVHARERALSQEKSDFITLMAHQLRTPLSAIKWIFRGLIEGDMGRVTKEQYEILERGHESTERIIRLVADMLDIASIEEGRFGYVFGEHSLEMIIEETLNSFRAFAEEKKLRMIFKQPDAPLPHVHIDKAKIELVLSNLIENAVHYTLSGGEVIVSIGRKNSEIEVSVRDTGIGIPQEQIPRVFSRFFRAPNAMKVETEGSGLGLYLAKNIIEKHGGRIWFESQEGRGTTFYFTVPISPPKESVPAKKYEKFLKDF